MMVTKGLLQKLIALAEHYWSSGNTKALHTMWNLLEGLDEDDAIYEIAHICAKRKLSLDTFASVLKTLGFEIGDDNA